MSKIAIIGYGKMGREIEKLIVEKDHLITSIIDNENDWEKSENTLLQSDVAIDFSTPETVVAHVRYCIASQIPIVIGTTGWQQQIKELTDYAHTKKASLIYGSNFSIGANLFFTVNELLAKLMNREKNYDVSIRETHHANKIDKPSGTAVTLAELLISQLDRKMNWKLDAFEMDLIRINSFRKEDVKGLHEIIWDSPEDTITLIHEAKSRVGFAYGALRAAEWLIDNPGIYNFKNIYQYL